MAYQPDGKQHPTAPHGVNAPYATVTLATMDKSARDILAENLWTLIRAHPGNAERPSVRAWALAHHLDEKKVHRALHAVDVQLVATVDDIAGKLNRAAWELLFPGLKAHRRPAPPELAADAMDVAKALDKIRDPERRATAYALMLQVAVAVNVPTPSAPSTQAPSPPPTARPVRHR